MMRLGLTGGIGSGKSTVATLLASLGAVLIDADAISRAATAPGGAAMAAIQSVFGPNMLTREGALNRDQMRSVVYSDPTAKARLEAIVHPVVGAEIAKQSQQAAFTGTACAVFDIPLLVESGRWRALLDRVIVIDCTEATQMARVMARNGLTAPEVQRIITAQATRAERLACADCVLFNDDLSLDDLRLHVQQIGTQFGL